MTDDRWVSTEAHYTKLALRRLSLLSSVMLFSHTDHDSPSKQQIIALAWILVFISSTRLCTRSEPATLTEVTRQRTWRREEPAKQHGVVKGNREDAAHIIRRRSQPELLVTWQRLEVRVDFLVGHLFQGCWVPLGSARTVD